MIEPRKERRRVAVVKPTARVLTIDAIHIGKRYRKDMGDVAGLADDIANHVGLLLHPIVVRRVGRQWWLVCGARRLQAEKLLGRKTVPVTAHYDMDDATALRAECPSENMLNPLNRL